MAVGVRSSEEKVVGSIDLRTGIALVSVGAIAPTKEELSEKFGFEDPKDPPAAVTEKEGVPQVRLDFWLQGPDDFLHRESFFLTKRPRTSMDGSSQQWVNNFAQFCYAPTGEQPNFDWFNSEGQRPAWEGEQELIEFIRAWVNHKGGKKGEELYFENWDAIFAGNFSEIKGILAQIDPKNPNKVGVLFGVRTVDKDGTVNQYQTIYKKFFGRPYQNLFSEFSKRVAGEYGKFKHDYQNSFEWQTYKGNAAAATQSEAQPAGTGGATPWAGS